MPLQHKVCKCGKSFFTAKATIDICPSCRKGKYAQTWKDRRYGILHTQASGHTWDEWRDKIAGYDNKCAYCGLLLFNLDGKFTGERDHRVPICRGGTDKIENIVPSCRACNLHKSTMTYIEYKAKWPGGAPQYYRVSTGKSSPSYLARVVSSTVFPADARLIEGACGIPALVLGPDEICELHPDSGRTAQNTCWGCYSIRASVTKKPNESAQHQDTLKENLG